MAKNVVCKKCNNLANDWCEKVIDSPDQDMQRDCQYFCEKTNADKIRAMSDEELAEFLSVGVVAVFVCDLCEIVGVSRAECNVNSCRKAVLKWLHLPAEVDHAKE